MRGVRDQAAVSPFVIVALILGVSVAPPICAQQKETVSAKDLAAQLDDACDGLRLTAIQGPYGWGWAAPSVEERGADAKNAGKSTMKTKRQPAPRKRGEPAPNIDLRTTAAAGLVLHLASRHVSREANAEAAMQAARAIVAVQLPTGQVPPSARLVPKPAGHPENVGIVPDRGPTCAALGFLLAMIDANKEKPDPRLVTAATRAATWLARQQTSAGGWQSAWPPGPGVTSRRIIRLDDAGYRDATYALLLASRVLNRQEYAMAADRSVDQLLKLRIRTEGSSGVGLWSVAHTLGGDPVDDVRELPRDIDLLATQHALETLLAAQLITNKPNLPTEIAASVKAVVALPAANGGWVRRYDLFLRRKLPTTAPSEETKDTSGGQDEQDKQDEADGPVKPALPDPFDQAAYALVLQSVNAALAKRPDGKNVPEQERLAWTLSGLSTDPLTLRVRPREEMHVLIRQAVEALSQMNGS
jgi:hypothetical protein